MKKFSIYNDNKKKTKRWSFHTEIDNKGDLCTSIVDAEDGKLITKLMGIGVESGKLWRVICVDKILYQEGYSNQGLTFDGDGRIMNYE